MLPPLPYPHSRDGDGYAPGEGDNDGIALQIIGATSTLIGMIAAEAADAAPLEDGDSTKLSAFLHFLLVLPPDDDDDAIVGLWDLDDGIAEGPPRSFSMGVDRGGGGGFAVADALPRMPVAAAEHLFFNFVMLCSPSEPSEYCGCCCWWEK
jgi:hypothetical protein